MIKTALTAALVFGSVSVALASEFDPNLGNRYPQATTQMPEPQRRADRLGRHQRRAGLVRPRVAQLRRWLLSLACYLAALADGKSFHTSLPSAPNSREPVSPRRFCP